VLRALRGFVHYSPCLKGAALQSLGKNIAATLRQPNQDTWGQDIHIAAAELLADILLRAWDSDVQELAKAPGLKHSLMNALDSFCHQDILDPLRYVMPTWLVYGQHVLPLPTVNCELVRLVAVSKVHGVPVMSSWALTHHS
jgi:hypothetical protein